MDKVFETQGPLLLQFPGWCVDRLPKDFFCQAICCINDNNGSICLLDSV